MSAFIPHASIFRAYDIRGIVGETLTEETVFWLGKAFGSCVREKGENHVIVARDGRISGPEFAKNLQAGILSSGCDITDLGMVPTPLLYYATHVLQHPSGVMLTGSHNPANYNGLKCVLNKLTISEQEIQALYQRIVQQKFSEGCGTRYEENIVDRYLAEITQTISLKRSLRLVIDAGNGVTGAIAPRLFRALGCEVQELFCEVDGAFPNHHPDPNEAKNLQQLIAAVKNSNADLGLAFDGDGDRLGVVTQQGEIIWPDRLLIIFAKYLLHKQPGEKIIFDVKCTQHLATLIEAYGGQAVMWKTGHSLIKTKMAEINAKLGGEMSGHFFFKDRWYGFDDAMYAGVRLLEILAEQEDSQAVFDAIPNSINTSELKILVTEEEKFSLMDKLLNAARFHEAKEINTIDGLRVNFKDGWGLLRPSNTSPYLVLRFEAANEGILKNIQNLFRDWILSVNPNLVLPF